ncbi:MAG: cation:dicarboxylase symporter family transporter, partial [Clostridia bacterium]|nr:cation:dicarboxylase symporter family transporter [Clostridia bacterium]
MKKFLKNYWFILSMLVGIVAGCITGAFWPGATVLEPLGTLFINLMFCVVVPMVFCSISSAIANMKSARRAGKVMGTTVVTFMVTAGIAAVLMYVVTLLVPGGLVSSNYTVESGEVAETLGFADMVINFFTKPDFVELLSRRAMLPLIVFAVLFGFGVQMAGEKGEGVARGLANI